MQHSTICVWSSMNALLVGGIHYQQMDLGWASTWPITLAPLIPFKSSRQLPNRPGKYPKSLLWKKASCHEGVESQRAIIQHHEYNYVELQITAQQICKISKENYGLKLDFALSAFHHVCPCMNNDRINCMFKCLKRPSVCWHLPDVRTYCGRENNDSTLSGKSRSYNCAYFDSAEQFLSCLLPIDNFSFFKSWFFPNFSSFNCLNLTRPSQ